MSSDNRTPRWEPTWRNIGTGGNVTFRCCDCELPKPTLGRKRTQIGWRCAVCVKAKEAKKVQA